MEPMPEKDRRWIAWAVIVALIVVSTITGIKFPIPEPPIEPLGYTHFSGLVVTEPTTVTTATPGAVINSNGLGGSNLSHLTVSGNTFIDESSISNESLDKRLRELAMKALFHYSQAETGLREGNWTRYGEQLKLLKDVLEKMNRLR